MPGHPLRILAVLAVSVVSLALLSGCAIIEEGTRGSARHLTRDAVTQLVRDISHRRADDIDQWAILAETADSRYGAVITLIDITPRTAHEPTDPLGTLSFRSEATVSNRGLWSGGTESSTACYAVDFTRYGPLDHARLGQASSPVRGIPCPDETTAVTPPPDTTTVLVTPEGAADVIITALSEAPEEVLVSDLRRTIESRLTPPTGPYERLAPVDVMRADDGSIGVAMGDTARCVLVRRAGAVAEQVHAPRVLLQRGELGCRGATALSDLRPPH